MPGKPEDKKEPPAPQTKPAATGFKKKAKDVWDRIVLIGIAILFLPFAPFYIDAGVTKYEKELPGAWVHAWKRLWRSAGCFIALLVLAYVRLKTTNAWWAFLEDAAFLSFAIRGLVINFWDLSVYVILPKTPGITQLGGEGLLDKSEKALRELLETARKNFLKDVSDGALATIARAIADFCLEFGRNYIKEVLIRGSLIYLSFRYALMLVFLVFTFAGIYDWLGLVSAQAFNTLGGAPSLTDFVFYSVDILTTSSISDITAATYLTKTTATIQLGMGFFSLVLFIPLIFVCYDRAVVMSEEIRKTREKHSMIGFSEFISDKLGLSKTEALKLMMDELSLTEAEKLGIKITAHVEKQSSPPPIDVPPTNEPLA